jgi:amino acid permease
MESNDQPSDNPTLSNKQPSLTTLSSNLSEERDGIRPLIDIRKKKKKKRKKKFTYSNPNNEMLQRLNKQRSQNFFQRNFSALKGGSLRAVVIYWVRMTMGIGVMALPYYMKELGVLVGSIVILLAGMMSYFSFKYIFFAQYYTGEKDIVEITRKFIPGWMVSVYTYSLLIDVLSSMQIYSIVSWNLFAYMLNMFGMIKPEWIENPDTVKLKEYHPSVILLRTGFLHVIFFVSIPLLLKRSLESLKFVSIGFMISLIFVILMLFAQMPFFYKYYHHDIEPAKQTNVSYLYKPFWNLKFFSYLFSIVMAFYVQPFVMSLRKELLVPSMKRLKKVARLSVGFELIVFILLGALAYIVFGDRYTTDLIILRKPLPFYKGLDWVFKVLLLCFFLANTIGIPIFNVSLRDMIIRKYNHSRGYGKCYGCVYFFLFELSFLL